MQRIKPSTPLSRPGEQGAADFLDAFFSSDDDELALPPPSPPPPPPQQQQRQQRKPPPQPQQLPTTARHPPLPKLPSPQPAPDRPAPEPSIQQPSSSVQPGVCNIFTARPTAADNVTAAALVTPYRACEAAAAPARASTGTAAEGDGAPLDADRAVGGDGGGHRDEGGEGLHDQPRVVVLLLAHSGAHSCAAVAAAATATRAPLSSEHLRRPCAARAGLLASKRSLHHDNQF